MFYLKDHVPKKVKVNNSIPIRKADVTKIVDVATEKVGVLSDMSTIPKASETFLSKRVYLTLHYLPKANMVKIQPYELQSKELTFPIKKFMQSNHLQK